MMSAPVVFSKSSTARISQSISRNSRYAAVICRSLSSTLNDERSYATSSSPSFQASGGGMDMDNGHYISPFQDLFDSMHRNAPSSIASLEDVPVLKQVSQMWYPRGRLRIHYFYGPVRSRQRAPCCSQD
jgi:hypothetical protein